MFSIIHDQPNWYVVAIHPSHPDSETWDVENIARFDTLYGAAALIHFLNGGTAPNYAMTVIGSSEDEDNQH